MNQIISGFWNSIIYHDLPQVRLNSVPIPIITIQALHYRKRFHAQQFVTIELVNAFIIKKRKGFSLLRLKRRLLDCQKLKRPLSRISYVLVVPPKPRPRFVSPIRRPVEPLVHSPERVEAARVGGVGMVDDAVGECERAHSWRLASVGGEIGAGHGREIAWVEGVLTAL